MKKTLLFAALGLTICAGFTACTEDESDKNDDQLRQNIVGKWKTVSTDNKEQYTNEKCVQTYTADGKFTTTFLYSIAWQCATPGTYSISHGAVTTVTEPATVSAGVQINANEMIKSGYEVIKKDTLKLPRLLEDSFYVSLPDVSAHYERVTSDFSQSIIGLWEGDTLIASYETHGDANHRWDFKADGTYDYYTKVDTGWVLEPQIAIYFVDGNFIGSRWNKGGDLYTECWDIDKCTDTEMQWSALRKKPYPFNATLKMKKVK